MNTAATQSVPTSAQPVSADTASGSRGADASNRPLEWAQDLPMVLSEVEVVSVERLSPAFIRISLAGPGLAEVGLPDAGLDLEETDRQWWDQRFKLIVPDAGGGITEVTGADASWLSTWTERDVTERGHMRTYTIRRMYGQGAERRLVVDIVLHPASDPTAGEHPLGPGALWAEQAEPGARAVVLLPRRGHVFGGIEFAPGAGDDLLLVGDETAVPAICAILENLPPEARGAAFLEVPREADVLTVETESQVEIHWLPRNGQERGEIARFAALTHLEARGVHRASEGVDLDFESLVTEVDPDLWETPSYSSSGERIATDPEPDAGASVATSAGAGSEDAEEQRPFAGLYAWIAGESLVVTALRRHLVKELGIDRSQVAFMGYWRRGVAMKS